MAPWPDEDADPWRSEPAPAPTLMCDRLGRWLFFLTDEARGKGSDGADALELVCGAADEPLEDMTG